LLFISGLQVVINLSNLVCETEKLMERCKRIPQGSVANMKLFAHVQELHMLEVTSQE
jgi:hypothetical protein